MRYYIIAGEASGDLHGSNLVKAMKKLNPESTFRGWGGDMMTDAGVTIVKHYRELAFMGFSEVFANLPTILRNFSFCKSDILSFQPHALILIDYPGFNLRMAKWAKQRGIPVIYYISPQVWAWKESRVKTIKRCVDKMLVILPFEKAFYQKWNYDVEYVGHPLIEVIEAFKSKNQEVTPISNRSVIALLPGSRKQEIRMKLPIMLEVCNEFPDYHFVVAKAPGLESDFYNSFLMNFQNVSCVENSTYSLLCQAKAALVTSGTATLETALFGVPEIICYKGNAISYQIAKRLIKIKFIGLANLIMGREVIKELIQADLNKENLVRELNKLLNDKQEIERIESDYQSLYNLLQKDGHASNNAAKAIESYMKSLLPEK